ncbi:MAG: HAMP domain-containing histidine kinase [Deltaproteobacteria bacterium]|nr:HAMP domain-containing histidine kinase [Deltaproteobacteria bacterium]
MTTTKKTTDASSEKTLVLTTIAHEMRNFVTLIGGSVRLLLRDDIGPLNATQRKILRECQSSSERLNNFIDEIVALSRASRVKLKTAFENVYVTSFIRRVVRKFRGLAQEKDIAIRTRIARTRNPLVRMDQDRIEQVMINLLVNAIQYTEPGGRIEVRVTVPADDLVEVRVEDNGRGLLPEEQEIIFQEYKVGNAVSRENSMGLGLAICKKIIDDHHGRIWAETRNGGGSKFIFTLPVTTP